MVSPSITPITLALNGLLSGDTATVTTGTDYACATGPAIIPNIAIVLTLSTAKAGGFSGY